jgi:hypothetical protein
VKHPVKDYNAQCGEALFVHSALKRLFRFEKHAGDIVMLRRGAHK